jgi:hypothetical protein
MISPIQVRQHIHVQHSLEAKTRFRRRLVLGEDSFLSAEGNLRGGGELTGSSPPNFSGGGGAPRSLSPLASSKVTIISLDGGACACRDNYPLLSDKRLSAGTMQHADALWSSPALVARAFRRFLFDSTWEPPSVGLGPLCLRAPPWTWLWHRCEAFPIFRMRGSSLLSPAHAPLPLRRRRRIFLACHRAVPSPPWFYSSTQTTR